MFGFVIIPKNERLSARLDKILESFRTLAVDAKYETSERSVVVYRTKSSNNYRFVSDSGRLLVACGTLMLGALRGQRAIELVAKRLDAGESLKDLYDELRGPFSLLLIHPEANILSVVTDRDGLMCCYETAHAQAQMTSSGLLLLAALSHSAVDPVGVQEFVHGGACVNDRTLYSGIKRVPAASLTELGAAVPSRHILWRATVRSPYLPDSDGQIVDKMHQLFSTALNTELTDARKAFATDLTAGTDSRTVLSFLLRTGQPLVASTAGAAGHVDVARAQEISKIAGIEHYWYEVENTLDFDQRLLDECVEYSDGAISPFGLTKQIPYFEQKADRFDMLFGGNGGPLFKDHYWLFEFNRIDQPREPSWDRIARYSLTEGKVNNELFVGGVDYIGHMKSMFASNSKKINGSNNQKLDFMYFDFKNRSFAAAQFTFSNKFMDVYHPMCDGKIVEYSMSIRPWIRKRARLQSELIFRNSQKIAWALTDNYVPCVPDTGVYFYLRALRVVRYARALRRKLSDFVLNKKRVAKDSRALTFVASLKNTDLAAAYQHPERLSLAPLLNIQEVKRLCVAASNGEHSGYLQRLFAVEAILRKVQVARGSDAVASTVAV